MAAEDAGTGDGELGYYDEWSGWPEPPRRSEYGLLKALLDGVDFGADHHWDDGSDDDGVDAPLY